MGLPGTDAENGVPGLPGPPGPPGENGYNGIDGPPGARGMPGRVGLPGVRGAIGEPGPVGLQGPPGTMGRTGAVGKTGLPGVPGAPGLQGAPGAPGPVGEPGRNGANGAEGAEGQAVVESPVAAGGHRVPAPESTAFTPEQYAQVCRQTCSHVHTIEPAARARDACPRIARSLVCSPHTPRRRHVTGTGARTDSKPVCASQYLQEAIAAAQRAGCACARAPQAAATRGCPCVQQELHAVVGARGKAGAAEQASDGVALRARAGARVGQNERAGESIKAALRRVVRASERAATAGRRGRRVGGA